MKPDPIVPVAAEVRQDTESESALIQTAREALSTCNWTIGQCAADWTARWARGRGDADFGAQIGLSGDQVYQRRRVWEQWSGKTDTYRNLSWSHFYAALNWDDATECLQWASEKQATVGEMKAWRSAQRDPFGEDDPFDDDDSGDQELPPTPSTDSDDDEASGDSEDPGGDEEPPKRTPAEELRLQKSKAVKTAEALCRAICDVSDLRKKPQKCKALLARIYPIIEEVKGW